MPFARRADDGGGDSRLREHPRESLLRHRPSMRSGDLFKVVHYHLVERVCRAPDHRRDFVNRVARRLRAPRMRAPAARERTPRHDGHLAVSAERKYLALLLAIDEVVLRLKREDLRPSVPFGDLLHSLQLPREDGGGSDVAGLAALHNIVQRLHDLLHRRIRVEAVDLVEVHVVHVEALERMVDLRQDVLARGAAAVGPPRAHVEMHLRGDDDLVTVESEVADEPSRDLLARPHLIDVRRVEVVDAEVDGLLEERLRVVVVPRPREDSVLLAGLAEAHHAEADA